jgi:hypothetical protein
MVDERQVDIDPIAVRRQSWPGFSNGFGLSRRPTGKVGQQQPVGISLQIVDNLGIEAHAGRDE